MKRSLFSTLTAFCLLAATAQAADDVKLKLADAKFKLGEGTPSDLVGHNDGEGKIFYYAPGVSASCDPAQNVNANFKLAIDGKDVGEEVKLTSEGEKEYKLETKLAPGEHKLTITFTNDVYKEGEYDRNLYIHSVTLKVKK
jgi:hypothetical protein